MKIFVVLCVLWALVVFVIVLVSASFPPPTANFISDTTSVCPYEVITFTDTSTYSSGTGTGTAWWWLFGDSQDSHAENPTHYYDTPGVYTVQFRATDFWGEGWENKTRYITVRDCYTADFSSNSTCSIGKPKVINLTSTCEVPLGKSGWTISPFPGWTYWNGTDWVEDNDGTFTSDLSGTLNPQINFTSYGSYTITQGCNFGATVGTISTTKFDYIKVGVNGTYCGTGCSAGGSTRTDWLPVAVVLSFVPVWILIVFASRQTKKL
jgi:hypothetical protein